MSKRGSRADPPSENGGGSSDERDRVQVKTTIPAYQKRAWQDDADEFGMSLSEFVRSMVQAGRRGYEHDRVNRGDDDATPGVEAVEMAILDVLRDGPMNPDELRRETLRSLEEEFQPAFERLESENRIQYDVEREGFVPTG